MFEDFVVKRVTASSVGVLCSVRAADGARRCVECKQDISKGSLCMQFMFVGGSMCLVCAEQYFQFIARRVNGWRVRPEAMEMEGSL